MQKLTLTEEDLKTSLEYHLNNKINLIENLYRLGSEGYFSIFNYARYLLETKQYEFSDIDKHILTETEIGNFAFYEGRKVPLDCPFVIDEDEEDLTEAEKDKNVQLNKPKRNTGGGKKYYVYVRDPKTGNVKKISFGDEHGGLTSKINDPEARKSFAARHDCEHTKDKTTAGYWACRLPRYAKSLGLSGGGNYWW